MKLFRELLVEETFTSRIENIETKYHLKENDSVEYHFTRFFDNNQNQHIYFSKVSHDLLFEWMNYLDFGRYPEDTSTKTLLRSFLQDINICLSINSFNNYIPMDFTAELKTIFNTILSKYSYYVDLQPFFQHYFAFIYEILYNIHCIIKNIESFSTYYPAVLKAQQEIDKFITLAVINHNQFTEYINKAIVIPIKYKHIRKTTDLILSYECYLNSLKKKSAYSEAIYYDKSDLSWEDIQYDLSMIDNQTRINDELLTDEIDEVKYVDDIIDEVNVLNDYTFIKHFEFGIKYLITKELVLKKCDFCGRYFLNKYSFSANYCNKQYKSSKATCQEYISRYNYKIRASANPISTEYAKIYNRIYSRVRRGSMTEEEAKLDKLKELRDIYIEKYENASENEKDKIVSYYILQANSLY
jgi:hypothetical protein